VSNKQAAHILNNASAVQLLVRETGMKLPDNASGKRAAVKEAVARLATAGDADTRYSAGDAETAGIREQLRGSQASLDAMEPVTQIQTPGEFEGMDVAQTPDGSVFELEDTKTGQDPPIRRESPETGSLATAKDPASQDAAVNKDEPGHRQEQPLVTAPNISASQDGTGVNQESVGAAPEGFTGKAGYYDLLTDKNAQPDRPGDVRPMEVLKKDTNGKRVTEFAANAYGSALTSDYSADTIQEMIMEGVLGFDVQHQNDTIEKAYQRIAKDGVSTVAHQISADVGAGKITDENIAAATLLYSKFAQDPDAQGDAAAMLAAMGKMSNMTGRYLNLFKLMRKMTGQGQLAAVEHMVREAVNRVNRTRSKKNKLDIQIPEEMKQAFMEAVQEEMNKVEGATERKEEIANQIYSYVAAKMPATFMERANAWRYMAMLTNPRTWVRNGAGSLLMRPMVDAKRLIGAAIESLTLEKKERTKSVLGFGKKASAWMTWAKENAKSVNVQEALERSGSTSDHDPNKILDQRQIFDNKFLEGLREFSKLVPEQTDMFFKRREYAVSLASFLKARGYTAADAQNGKIPEAQLAEARSYAVQEALRATFNDCNALSDLLSSLGRSSDKRAVQAANLIVEGILPFRRTPANILSRAIADYSPVGIVRGVGNLAGKVRKGEMSAATAIDKIAAGLTGSALLGFGIALARGVIPGIRLVGHLEDEEEKARGRQSYALEIGNHSFTVDWAAPACIPLFVGANISSWWDEDTDTSGVLTVLNAFGTALEPMLELSCLSALNDLVQDVKYAQEGEEVYAIAASIATSYVSQFIPTALGQAERAFEGDKMMVYSDADSGVEKTFQRFVGGVTQKIPGVDLYQAKKYDRLGEDHGVQNRIGGVAQAVGVPFNTSIIQDSEVLDELSRLNDAQDANVSLPGVSGAVSYKDNQGNLQERRLSAKEYETVSRVAGQTQSKLLAKLFETKAYEALSDEEKAAAVKKVYAYAKEQGYREAISDYGKTPDSWMIGIEGREADVIITRTVCSSINSALSAYGEADKTGIGMDLAIAAMNEAYDTYKRLPAAAKKAVKEELGENSKGMKFLNARDSGSGSDAFGELYQANPGNYDKITSTDISDSVAVYVSNLLRDIQPEEGKTSVRNIQKMEAIVEDDRISDADVEKLLPLYLSEGGQENYETALDRGYDSEDFVAAYRIYLDKEKGEKKNAVIREIAADTGISYSAAKRLYEIVTEPHPKD
jgi:hypothetical protein